MKSEREGKEEEEEKEELRRCQSYRANVCDAAASSESIGNFWPCCAFPRADAGATSVDGPAVSKDGPAVMRDGPPVIVLPCVIEVLWSACMMDLPASDSFQLAKDPWEFEASRG